MLNTYLIILMTKINNPQLSVNKIFLTSGRRKEGRKEILIYWHSQHSHSHGRKEMFYLMTYSTHFIYGYMVGRKCFIQQHTQHILFMVIWKEENVFNNILSTFYLRLYGRKEMIYLTTYSTHFIYCYMNGLLFPISKSSFICTIPNTGQHIPRPLLYPIVVNWLERKNPQWANHEGLIRKTHWTMNGCYTMELHLTSHLKEVTTNMQGPSWKEFTSREFSGIFLKIISKCLI